MTSFLEARGVAVPGRLEPTDLCCAAGEMTAVIGPNGAGKTSLLRALAGIEPCEGKLTICGEDAAAAPPSRRMRLLSFLPATRALVWPISARDVIALGLQSPDDARVEELVQLLELGPLGNRPVNALSTGERSRVLLARALAARPRLLLLDEPLANLDPYWVMSLLGILRQVATNEGCAVLASLHDLSQAAAFDRALLVDDAKIVSDCPPEEMLASEALGKAFRIERSGRGWRIREKVSPAEGPRSSP